MIDTSILWCLRNHFRVGLKQSWVDEIENIDVMYSRLIMEPNPHYSNVELFLMVGMVIFMGLEEIRCSHEKIPELCGIRKLVNLGAHGRYPDIHNYAFTEVENPDENSPLGQYVRDSIRAGLEDLLINEHELFELDANERSITHRLAIRLEEYFPGFDIDCEYNRDGVDPKRLLLEGTCQNPQPSNPIYDDENSLRAVYPDIIIHKRGQQENLAVIEAKKSNNTEVCRDKRKLRSYKNDLGYQIGFQVVLPVDDEYWLYVRMFDDIESYKFKIYSAEEISCSCSK